MTYKRATQRKITIISNKAKRGKDIYTKNRVVIFKEAIKANYL